MHRLTNLRPEERRADCSVCGLDAPIQSRGVGRGFRCYTSRKTQGRSYTAEQRREWMLKMEYGITQEEYEALLEAQDGLCAICQLPCASGKRLAVDHCHTSGRVRGLLCRKCNRGIGNFEDRSDWLRRAADYLDR